MSKNDSIIKGLTQKQALFVSEYLKNEGNATEAYIQAGYQAKNRNIARTMASRLLTNANVSRAISERQQKRNERLQLEEDFELKQALKLFKMCTEPRPEYKWDGTIRTDEEGKPFYTYDFDSKGANAALTIICKLRGKFIEKKQIDVTLSDRSDWLAEALKDVNNDE